jgi:hypothetical protein
MNSSRKKSFSFSKVFLVGVMFLSALGIAQEVKKPGIVFRPGNENAPAKSLETVLKDLRRWSASNRATSKEDLPQTIYEVPALISKSIEESTTKESVFQLTGPDGNVVKLPSYAFRLNGKDDIDDATYDRITRNVASVWRGTPAADLFLDENDVLYFDDQKLSIVFGEDDEAGSEDARPFLEESQPKLYKQFLSHFKKVTFAAREENLAGVEFDGWTGNTDEKTKFYFGVKYFDNVLLSQQTEYQLQAEIARVITGEDAPSLKIDESNGNITAAGKLLKIRFFYITKDPVALLPLKVEREMLDKFRRHAKYVLITKRAQEELRKTQIAEGGKYLAEAETLFASKTEEKSKRLKELAGALEKAGKGETILKKYTKGEADVGAKLARITALRADINTAIDANTFPLVMETNTSCRAFKLRQESRTLFSLSHVAESGETKTAALLSQAPIWIECSGNDAVVYAKWREPREGDKPAVTLDTQLAAGPSLTREMLAQAAEPVLLLFRSGSLVIAQAPVSEDGFASASFVEIGPGIAGVRVLPEANPYHQYEFPLDGSFFRTRLKADSKSTEFSFFLMQDNSVQIVQNQADRESLKATVKGFDVRTASPGSKSLVFKATSVVAGEDVTVEPKTKVTEGGTGGTVYLLNQGKIAPIAEDTAEKVYSSVRFDEATQKFQLRLEGNEASFQEIALEGALLRRRLTLPGGCDKAFRVVVTEDGTTSLYSVDAANQELELAQVKGLGDVACSANSIAFRASSLASVDGRLTWTPAKGAPALTEAEVASGAGRALIMIADKSVVGALPMPSDVEASLSAVDENAGFVLTLKWNGELSSKIAPNGTWTGSRWYGSLTESKHSLLSVGSENDTSSCLLFYNKKPVAFLKGVRSAAALKEVASIVANEVKMASPVAEGSLQKSVLAVAGAKGDTISGNGLLFSFLNGNLVAVEGALNVKESGGVDSVSLVEKKDQVWRHVRFQDKQDYSVLVDMEGQNPDPRPSGEKKNIEWRSAPRAETK